jgi:hypothetical protein
MGNTGQWQYIDWPYGNDQSVIGFTLMDGWNAYTTALVVLFSMADGRERATGWEMHQEVQWLQISPDRLTLEPGEDGETTLLFNSAGLEDDTYSATVRATHNTFASPTLISVEMVVGPTATGENGAAAPDRFALHAPYPNPFNQVTRVRFDLPERANVTLKLFDVLGREVATLQKGAVQPGSHRLSFDARGLASGVYFLQLDVPGRFQGVRKILLVK